MAGKMHSMSRRDAVVRAIKAAEAAEKAADYSPEEAKALAQISMAWSQISTSIASPSMLNGRAMPQITVDWPEE